MLDSVIIDSQSHPSKTQNPNNQAKIDASLLKALKLFAKNHQ